MSLRPKSPHATHDDICDRLDETDDRLDRGEARFKAMDDKIDKILAKLDVLPKMEADLAATKDIVEAWSTVKNMGRFLKWAAGIIAAISAIVVAVKVGATHLMR